MGNKDPLVSIDSSAGVAGIRCYEQLLHECWGFELTSLFSQEVLLPIELPPSPTVLTASALLSWVYHPTLKKLSHKSSNFNPAPVPKTLKPHLYYSFPVPGETLHNYYNSQQTKAGYEDKEVFMKFVWVLVSDKCQSL